jgi:general nucleoside transport system permease protein
MMIEILGSLVPATFYFATPLILAAVGELVVERAGVVNIGIEGMMLAGALGAWAADTWHGPVAGIVAAMLAAIALALPFAAATLVFAADQIVTGTGINLLALGVTGMAYKLVPEERVARVVGVNARWLIVLTPIVAAAVWAYLRFTRWGLELAAIGESPQAADTAGVAVNRRKFFAILFGAACAGVAGAYLSIMYNRTFTENMTDGIGFLALAMVIFGRWNAGGIIAAGLFFGLVRAIANHIETRGLGLSPATLRMFGMLPYVVSLAALAGVAGKSGAPAALGKAYVRE